MNEEMIEISQRALDQIHARNKALDAKCQQLEKELQEIKDAMQSEGYKIK